MAIIDATLILEDAESIISQSRKAQPTIPTDDDNHPVAFDPFRRDNLILSP